jgi:hypothetical protein
VSARSGGKLQTGSRHRGSVAGVCADDPGWWSGGALERGGVGDEPPLTMASAGRRGSEQRQATATDGHFTHWSSGLAAW